MAKKYKPKKPDSKVKVKKIQDTEGLNYEFGEYEESTGGGHPFEAGDSNTRTTKENGKIRHAENPKTDQPRTGDGKFTYKSVNGKSIDPKYGPSRGVTVPPTLTGGENGIRIEDVENQFTNKSGSYYDKYKDKWYNKGGEVITTGLATKVSGQAVWKQSKEYNEELGEYDKIVGQIFLGKGEENNWTTKTGKKGKEEKATMEEVEKSGEQAFVKEKESGAIKVKPGTKQKMQEFINKKKGTPTEVKEEVKEEVKSEPEVKDEPWGKTGKFTKSQYEKAKEKIKTEMGADYDEEMWDDETIEEYMGEDPEIYA